MAKNGSRAPSPPPASRLPPLLRTPMFWDPVCLWPALGLGATRVLPCGRSPTETAQQTMSIGPGPTWRGARAIALPVWRAHRRHWLFNRSSYRHGVRHGLSGTRLSPLAYPFAHRCGRRGLWSDRPLGLYRRARDPCPQPCSSAACCNGFEPEPSYQRRPCCPSGALPPRMPQRTGGSASLRQQAGCHRCYWRDKRNKQCQAAAILDARLVTSGPVGSQTGPVCSQCESLYARLRRPARSKPSPVRFWPYANLRTGAALSLCVSVLQDLLNVSPRGCTLAVIGRRRKWLPVPKVPNAYIWTL